MTRKRKYENRKKNLTQYYNTFYQRLKRDYPKTIGNKPTIIFHSYVLLLDEKAALELEGIGDKKEHSYLVDGIFEDKKNQIHIFGVARYDIGLLKQTIRHETLHGFLFNTGKEWGDESTLFLLLAIKYNAKPYGFLINRREARDNADLQGRADTQEP